MAGGVVPQGGSAEEAARTPPSAGLRFPGSRARPEGAGLSRGRGGAVVVAAAACAGLVGGGRGGEARL